MNMSKDTVQTPGYPGARESQVTTVTGTGRYFAQTTTEVTTVGELPLGSGIGTSRQPLESVSSISKD